MPLGLEPQPMPASERCCVSTIQQALDLATCPTRKRAARFGLAINVYHVWWDPVLGEQLERAGGKGLLAFHSQIPCF